jgi:hypothetical protein
MIKRPKYRNVKVFVAGKKFDSKREHKRFTELQILEKAGQISNLQTQVKFELLPKQKKPSGGTERAVNYIADFVYTLPDGKDVVEDSKGVRTPDYVIKRKLMLQVHGIEIQEV